ncbi:hypothetical protein Tco_0251133 [Tanacetum coccineum]
MHTRASNSKLVEPLAEPERTLNRRLHRRNMRVPFEQRDERREHPIIIYPPVLDINYFRHFLDILENHNPIDDEPMWAFDRVVAPTPCFAITIPETANEFAIKGSNNSDTGKIMARMDAMTMKMDAQYKELQSRLNHSNPDCNVDDISMSRKEEAKFIQTFRRTQAKFDKFADKQSGRHFGSLPSSIQPNKKGSSSKPYQPPQARNEHVNAVFTLSSKSYDPPTNPNDKQNDSETPINFDSEDEEEESTP